MLPGGRSLLYCSPKCYLVSPYTRTLPSAVFSNLGAIRKQRPAIRREIAGKSGVKLFLNLFSNSFSTACGQWQPALQSSRYEEIRRIRAMGRCQRPWRAFQKFLDLKSQGAPSLLPWFAVSFCLPARPAKQTAGAVAFGQLIRVHLQFFSTQKEVPRGNLLACLRVCLAIIRWCSCLEPRQFVHRVAQCLQLGARVSVVD